MVPDATGPAHTGATGPDSGCERATTVSAPEVADAARNNAEWCDLVCRTHGAAGTFGLHTWSTSVRSPRYYPDAVTLDAQVSADEVLPLVEASAGCSIKDSFATLDLAPAGFRVLFEAQWIGRRPEPGATSPVAAKWQRITDPRALQEWEAAWANPDEPTGLFRSALLDDPDVMVLGGRVAGALAEGAVLNRAANVVGVTNLFSRHGELDAAFDASVNAASAYFPNEPIVGYESGEALAAARRNGFVALAPLRVWIRD